MGIGQPHVSLLLHEGERVGIVVGIAEAEAAEGCVQIAEENNGAGGCADADARDHAPSSRVPSRPDLGERQECNQDRSRGCGILCDCRPSSGEPNCESPPEIGSAIGELYCRGEGKEQIGPDQSMCPE